MKTLEITLFGNANLDFPFLVYSDHDKNNDTKNSDTRIPTIVEILTHTLFIFYSESAWRSCGRRPDLWDHQDKGLEEDGMNTIGWPPRRGYITVVLVPIRGDGTVGTTATVNLTNSKRKVTTQEKSQQFC